MCYYLSVMFTKEPRTDKPINGPSQCQTISQAMPFTPRQNLKLPPRVAAARKHFKAAGWSYRAAAPVLGVTYQHLCMVLTGERESRRLTTRILALPNRKS